MKKEKEQMYTLTQELLRYRAPSPYYPVFLFEHMNLFKMRDLKKADLVKSWKPLSFWKTLLKVTFLNIICYVNYTCMKWHALWTLSITQFLTSGTFTWGHSLLLSPTICTTGMLLRTFTGIRTIPLCRFIVNLSPLCPWLLDTKYIFHLLKRLVS